MSKRLEVRCCCQPQKLLGWVTVDDATAERATRLVIRQVMEPAEMQKKFGDLRPIGQYVTNFVELPFAYFNPGGFEPAYLAIKAEGYDQEELKGLLGDRFEPAL